MIVARGFGRGGLTWALSCATRSCSTTSHAGGGNRDNDARQGKASSNAEDDPSQTHPPSALDKRDQRTRARHESLLQLFQSGGVGGKSLPQHSPGTFRTSAPTSSERGGFEWPTRAIDFAADDDAPIGGLVRSDNVDDAECGSLQPKPSALQSLPQSGRERGAFVATEHDLLDDNFTYFPPAVVVAGSAEAVTVEEGVPAPSGEGKVDSQHESAQTRVQPQYVPGQQIVPPGFTRYRVEVQYQGSDFDGWFKSTEKSWSKLVRMTSGEVRRVPLTPEEKRERIRTLAIMRGLSEAEVDAIEQDDDMASQPRARTVLEDALAVAFDVDRLHVEAAVVPEAGVSVRRLPCHVDIPSGIALQPRTILQRATMWLEKKGHPLAVLSCHPCKNQDFHARHSGVRRVYVYRILNRVAPPLFDAGMQWHVDRALDVARMQRFAASLQGTMDYGYFADPKMAHALRRAAASTGTAHRLVSAVIPGERHGHEPTTYASSSTSRDRQSAQAPKVDFQKGASNLQRAANLPTFDQYGRRVAAGLSPAEFHAAATNLPTVRTIDKIDVVRQDDEVLLWFVGQSFLRHQIRSMVSLLKAAGHGLWDERELQHALATGFESSRKKYERERLPPAPAHGLCLWDVEYPPQHRDDFVPYVDSGPYDEVSLADSL